MWEAADVPLYYAASERLKDPKSSKEEREHATLTLQHIGQFERLLRQNHWPLGSPIDVIQRHIEYQTQWYPGDYNATNDIPLERAYHTMARLATYHDIMDALGAMRTIKPWKVPTDFGTLPDYRVKAPEKTQPLKAKKTPAATRTTTTSFTVVVSPPSPSTPSSLSPPPPPPPEAAAETPRPPDRPRGNVDTLSRITFKLEGTQYDLPSYTKTGLKSLNANEIAEWLKCANALETTDQTSAKNIKAFFASVPHYYSILNGLQHAEHLATFDELTHRSYAGGKASWFQWLKSKVIGDYPTVDENWFKVTALSYLTEFVKEYADIEEKLLKGNFKVSGNPLDHVSAVRRSEACVYGDEAWTLYMYGTVVAPDNVLLVQQALKDNNDEFVRRSLILDEIYYSIFENNNPSIAEEMYTKAMGYGFVYDALEQNKKIVRKSEIVEKYGTASSKDKPLDSTKQLVFDQLWQWLTRTSDDEFIRQSRRMLKLLGDMKELKIPLIIRQTTNVANWNRKLPKRFDTPKTIKEDPEYAGFYINKEENVSVLRTLWKKVVYTLFYFSDSNLKSTKKYYDDQFFYLFNVNQPKLIDLKTAEFKNLKVNAEHNVRLFDIARELKIQGLRWTQNSCWLDSTMLAVFADGGAMPVQEFIKRSRAGSVTGYARTLTAVPAIGDPYDVVSACDKTAITKFYNAVLNDVLHMHGPNAAECPLSARELWNTCAMRPVANGDVSFADAAMETLQSAFFSEAHCYINQEMPLLLSEYLFRNVWLNAFSIDQHCKHGDDADELWMQVFFTGWSLEYGGFLREHPNRSFTMNVPDSLPQDPRFYLSSVVLGGAGHYTTLLRDIVNGGWFDVDVTSAGTNITATYEQLPNWAHVFSAETVNERKPVMFIYMQRAE